MDVPDQLSSKQRQSLIENVLHELELAEDERAVCLAASIGFKTAREIANGLEANRAEVYDLLVYLGRSGLVYQYLDKGIRRFHFASSQTLEQLLSKKQNQLDRLKELLTALSVISETNKPEVSHEQTG